MKERKNMPNFKFAVGDKVVVKEECRNREATGISSLDLNQEFTIKETLFNSYWGNHYKFNEDDAFVFDENWLELKVSK